MLCNHLQLHGRASKLISNCWDWKIAIFWEVSLFWTNICYFLTWYQTCALIVFCFIVFDCNSILWFFYLMWEVEGVRYIGVKDLFFVYCWVEFCTWWWVGVTTFCFNWFSLGALGLHLTCRAFQFVPSLSMSSCASFFFVACWAMNGILWQLECVHKIWKEPQSSYPLETEQDTVTAQLMERSSNPDTVIMHCITS